MHAHAYLQRRHRPAALRGGGERAPTAPIARRVSAAPAPHARGHERVPSAGHGVAHAEGHRVLTCAEQAVAEADAIEQLIASKEVVGEADARNHATNAVLVSSKIADMLLNMHKP